MHNVCCWDLEGPISVLDFAAEMAYLLSQKDDFDLHKYDMEDFFFMISNYDDYIIDVPGVKQKLKIPEYQPGDTLRLMAPMYVACFSEKDLINLAKKNLGLLPGCQELMQILQKNWEIFVISTSFAQFAHTVSLALQIPSDHVYCTDLNIDSLKEDLSNINHEVNVLIKVIYQKFLENNRNLNSVIEDLNNFFWKNKNSDYIKVMNQVKVRGGKRKELAVEEISKRTGVPISKMIALGDSITDINMLQRVNDEGGISISFNGNRFSAKYANLAVNTPNSMGVLPIFQLKNNLHIFLNEWEANFKYFKKDPKNISNGLISEECKRYFIKSNFVPEIVNLSNKTKDQFCEIVLRQERMRKKVRGKVGSLG
ncbi:MAG: HAD hydrolase family protein [Candidatus Hodarchaeota archaeon]